MGLVDLLLVLFIIGLGIISATGIKRPKTDEKDRDLARIRQMNEWDRFDDKKK